MLKKIKKRVWTELMVKGLKTIVVALSGLKVNLFVVLLFSFGVCADIIFQTKLGEKYFVQGVPRIVNWGGRSDNQWKCHLSSGVSCGKDRKKLLWKRAFKTFHGVINHRCAMACQGYCVWVCFNIANRLFEKLLRSMTSMINSFYYY